MSGTQRVKEEVEAAAEGGRITIKLQDTDRFRVNFTIRKTDKLQALIDFCYDSMPTIKRGACRFIVDGKRMQGWNTPDDFNMEDGDEVDVFTHMLGGAGRGGWTAR